MTVLVNKAIPKMNLVPCLAHTVTTYLIADHAIPDGLFLYSKDLFRGDKPFRKDLEVLLGFQSFS